MSEPKVIGKISGHSGEITISAEELATTDALEALEKKLQVRFEEAGRSYSLTTESLEDGGLKISWEETHG